MPIKVNCTFNDEGAWCKHTAVKRSLFGVGARCCIEYPMKDGICAHKVQFRRPSVPPNPPQPSRVS